jgi:hypothetical protein
MWRKLAGSVALAAALVHAPLAGAGAERLKQQRSGRSDAAPPSSSPSQAGKATKPAKPVLATRGVPADSNASTQPPPGLGTGAADLATDQAIDDVQSGIPEPAKHAPQILNLSEMLSLARKYAAEIAQALLDGERHREIAIREKDAIKLACIQDRLSNMKLMKRLADERLAATTRPTIRSDELNLRHEFRGVEMAHQRVGELRRELIDCVGQNLQIETPTGTIPTGADPSGTNAEIPTMDRPAPASPYN